MSDRTPTSVNLETDHAEWMDRENINCSELVNDLIDRYRSGRSQIDDAVREMRIEQLESEVDSLSTEAERKREELDQLREEHTRAEDFREEQLPEALEALSNIPSGKRGPDNPAVQHWADKLQMTATELLAELDEADDYGESL